TTINITGNFAMISGSTPGTNHAATHNFVAPVHLNSNTLLLAAPVGNSLQFFNGIDGTGGITITGTTAGANNNTGQGAVVIGNTPLTYTGPTRLLNTFGATNGGILPFFSDNLLPTNTQLIWRDVGLDSGYIN